MSLDGTVLAVNSDTREIAYVLVSTGKLVEKSCLSAVLVAHQGKGNNSSIRQRISASLRMIFSLFTKSRMFGTFRRRLIILFHLCF